MSFSDTIKYSDLTTEKFETTFKSRKYNKVSSKDNINSNIVLDTYDKIKDILFSIFKTSLQQGTFPKVTPLFKSGDAKNATNYRPILFLPQFPKILEKIIYNQIYKNLRNNNLLFDKQFEFQLNNTTGYAIFKIVIHISSSFERGNIQ